MFELLDADERSLVPAGEACTPLQAIIKVMGALANFDEGDTVTVVVKGSVPLTAWNGGSAYAALYWLATSVSQACCAMVPVPERWARRFRTRAGRDLTQH